jgi:hypothetical protein
VQQMMNDAEADRSSRFMVYSPSLSREIWQPSEAFAISEGAGGEPCRPDHPNAHVNLLDSTESMGMREYPIGAKRKRCRLSLSTMQGFDSGESLNRDSGGSRHRRGVGRGMEFGRGGQEAGACFPTSGAGGQGPGWECTPANHTPGQGWDVTDPGCEGPGVVIEGVGVRRAWKMPNFCGISDCSLPA